MYLQEHHLAALHENAKGHKHRVEELRQGIFAMEEESEVHETLLLMLDNDEIVNLLGQLLDDAQVAKQLQGLLPMNVQLNSIEIDDSAGNASGTLIIRSWRIRVRIDRDKGISLTPLNRGRLQQIDIVTTS